MKKSQPQSNFKHFAKDVAEHAIPHVIGHVVGGGVGGFFAGLFNVGTLNEGEDKMLRDIRINQIIEKYKKDNSTAKVTPPPKP
jgi:hypothetical protein